MTGQPAPTRDIEAVVAGLRKRAGALPVNPPRSGKHSAAVFNIQRTPRRSA